MIHTVLTETVMLTPKLCHCEQHEAQVSLPCGHRVLNYQVHRNLAGYVSGAWCVQCGAGYHWETDVPKLDG